MKTLLCLAGLLLIVPRLSSAPIVVYAKGDSTQLKADGSTPKPTDAARAAFLTAFEADLARPAAFKPPLKLIPPPELGRTVPGARGQIQFHAAFPLGFVVNLSITGLAPDHRYVLRLKGNPHRAGNQYLPEGGPADTAERHYEFLPITTSPQGHYRANLGLFLPPGFYDVQFCVQDSDDFLVVLYRDFFKFTVE